MKLVIRILIPLLIYTSNLFAQRNTFAANNYTPQNKYVLGQAALGGIIGYILEPRDQGYDASIQHGLVATIETKGNVIWGCSGTLLNGADGTAIGTRYQNTIDIITGCQEANIAAKLCWDLIEGGYDDWFLPSKDELKAIYNKKTATGLLNNGNEY